jgi:hypothetical protein
VRDFEAADEDLKFMKLIVHKDSLAIQSHQGKRFVLIRTEKDKRSLWKWLYSQQKQILIGHHSSSRELL